MPARWRPERDSNARPTANPKIGELAGVRQLPAERSGTGMVVRSGGGLDGDFVAEGLQLADVAALAAFGVDAGGVEPWPEVGEPGAGVREQVPGDDEDGAAHRDDGAF
jgi:hypothetical protein